MLNVTISPVCQVPEKYALASELAPNGLVQTQGLNLTIKKHDMYFIRVIHMRQMVNSARLGR